ncbi:ABC transporter substrate-binding protein [Niveispirillum irakense]|uniref:ABC transporter substrate-binding protein n=1 Tax=Niveispirillum irakense TaxID=34011 RepID=UPI000412E044|nr:ABC transporter substrate-binding protein [Niveispirillum irakense]
MTAAFILPRRSLLLGGLSLLALAGCGKEAPPSQKASSAGADAGAASLRIGTYRGQYQEFFGEAGVGQFPYGVSYSYFAGGNLIAEAINGGSIDLGSMSEIPPIFIASANAPMRLVATIKGEVTSQVVLVPEKSAIQTVADLKGKRIGYVRATTSHYILLRLLQEAGIGWGDITPVALSPQDGLAAFGRGDLDAWIIYGVQGSQARLTYKARVLTDGRGRLSGNYVFAASTTALADEGKRKAIADFLHRVTRAYAWADQNPEAWAARLSKETGVAPEIFLLQHRERDRPYELAKVEPEAIQSQQ